MLLARTDRSLLGKWWWTLDRTLLASLVILIAVGLVLVTSASPPVGMRKEGDAWHFVVRHLLFLGPTAVILAFCSLLSALGVLRVATGLLAAAGLGLLATALAGIEVNGARRWIELGGFRLQPSEFVKPALVVLTAYLLARRPRADALPDTLLLVLPPLALIAWQPDLGMAAVVMGVYAVQLFVAGIAWVWVLAIGAGGALAALGAYTAFPHVAARVDAFLAEGELGYQVRQALDAVTAGGLFGRGPGEGVVKYRLPDAHADFIFAATAEEFGILACLMLIGLFGFIIARAIRRIERARDRFVQLAAVGLLAGFALQALINMAVNLHLMPTKGMTLPFVSYGGSSMLALAIGMGMLMALTRRGAELERRA